MPDIVIGSGPSGVSAAKALLARGRTVLMLDAGRRLEDKAVARRDALAATAPQDWSGADRDAWQAPQYDTPDGQVRRFGSDFAMLPGNETLAEGADWLSLRASHAAGGLSNLWGSAVLPHRQADMEGWPITADDLAPHYAAVAGFMPVAAAPSPLDALLPAFPAGDRAPVPPGPQARALMQRLDARRTWLAQRGIHAGPARQAVDGDCRLCGMCLHGCPWGYIYSSRRTLDALHGQSGFSYYQGVAHRFGETADGVEVVLEGNETVTGSRLFLGAGVLETARLLLASRPGAGDELILQDSQHGFLPMVHRWRSPARPDRPPHHTLPQLFIELDDPAVSASLVHAQIYAWNEFYARELMANYGRKLPLAKPLLGAMARRLIVAQIFLHSDHSHRIGLRLAADGRLVPRLRENPETGATFRAAARALSRGMTRAGLLPLGFAARPGGPGSSFHVGGTVPMATAPGAGQSDVLGRPAGLSRVHLVDASALPSIPATTITFAVMANAHRIGTNAP